MRALDIKLLRDVCRLWPQVMAIALVIAAGVATLVLGVGANDSLFTTRERYYEASRLGDISANWAVHSFEVGRASVQTVSIGMRDDTYAEVISGLSKNARIVLHPSDRLQNGSRLTEAFISR